METKFPQRKCVAPKTPNLEHKIPPIWRKQCCALGWDTCAPCLEDKYIGVVVEGERSKWNLFHFSVAIIVAVVADALFLCLHLLMLNLTIVHLVFISRMSRAYLLLNSKIVILSRMSIQEPNWIWIARKSELDRDNRERTFLEAGYFRN